MNEHLKKLATQVGIDVEYLTNTKQIVLLNAFAELIVAECIQELNISKKCDPYTGKLFVCEHNTVIDEQIEMLKQHFKVKQSNIDQQLKNRSTYFGNNP